MSNDNKIILRPATDDDVHYVVVQACVIEQCLEAVTEYLDEHGPSLTLGPVVADLALIAALERLALEPNR